MSDKKLFDGQHESFEKKKQNKKLNIVLSIILAIVLWGYVIGEVDPETQKNFSKITVDIVNQEILADQGLTIVDSDELMVDILIHGKRSVLQKVGQDQIAAKIDLSECQLGENEVPVKVTLPDGVTSAEARPSSIRVIVDEVVTVVKPVKLTLSGELPEGYELGQITITPEEISVTGGKSVVNKITSLQATLEVIEGKTEYNETLSITPIGIDNTAIGGVVLGEGEISLQALVLPTKTVELRVITLDNAPEGYWAGPASELTVKIRAPEAVLEDISYIETKPVDLSEIVRDTRIAIELILP